MEILHLVMKMVDTDIIIHQQILYGTEYFFFICQNDRIGGQLKDGDNQGGASGQVLSKRYKNWVKSGFKMHT